MNWIEIGLYLTSILIWGSTWLVIKFQLGVVHPAVSVGYRFLVAGLLLLLYCVIKGHKLKYPARVHRLIALQALFLFCINYLCLYIAEMTLSSGVVAVLFSLLTISNGIGARFIFKEKLSPRFWIGTIVGTSGILFVFSGELKGFELTPVQVTSFFLAIVGTLSASAGNLVSKKIFQGDVHVIPASAIGMTYGALYTLIGCAAFGLPFEFEWNTRYLSSLSYLAVFGSIIAFVSYLTLLKRVGAGKAGYMSIVTPIVALILSFIFEGFQATPLVISGILLTLIGNALVMLRSKSRR
ncbi:MAG: EamA family transporter, partial [Proteobacteria bacterium]